MKVWLSILLLSLSLTGYSSSLENLRKAFHNSVLNPKELPTFINAISNIQFPSPLEEAYIGASEALLAREGWNPIAKINHLSNFRDLLEQAINKDSNNLEIRFLRYSIEFNIPKLLRSEANMTEDKVVIMENIEKTTELSIDNSFIIYILTLFEDTKSCTSEEISLIKERLVQ